jgi:hypothetical protein
MAIGRKLRSRLLAFCEVDLSRVIWDKVQLRSATSWLREVVSDR